MSAAPIELRANSAVQVAIGLVVAVVLVPLLLLGGWTGLVIAALIVAGFVGLCIALGRRRLILDEHGITQRRVLSTVTMSWDEIDSYTFWSMDLQMAYAAGGQGAIAMLILMAVVAIVQRANKRTKNRRFSSGQLKLFSTSGHKLVVDARYKHAQDALDRIFAEVHPRLRQRPRAFDPFTLGDTELAHTKKGTLGLPDIEKISVSSAHLSVKKRGKRLAWAKVHMKRLTNGMLFIEECAERGLVVDAGSGTFVPPTVLDKLRAATARQSAVPQARVVSR